MKSNLTEIVFILDRSGSMSHMIDDAIGGFNSFVETQKKEEGEALLTTILFDDRYEILHNGIDIKTVNPLTKKEYSARGMTALLDAIGNTVNTVGQRLDNMEEDEKPSKVIFVITTDGHENSSHEFTQPQIKTLIEQQTNKYGWQFLFLGANIDAISTAESFGISGQFASNYSPSKVGNDSLYMSLSKSVASYRSVGTMSADWKDEVK